MAATAAITAIAGTAFSAGSQIKAGNAQKRQAQVNANEIQDTSELNAQLLEATADTNAGVLTWNAKMLEAQSRDAVRRGFEDADRYAVTGRQAIGAQRANYAAQGVDVSVGSPQDMEKSSRYTFAQDLVTIRVNAAREAWGYQVEAENSRQQRDALLKNADLEAASTRRIGRVQALSTRMGGNNAQAAGRAGAVSTILGGAANLAYQGYSSSRSTRTTPPIVSSGRIS